MERGLKEQDGGGLKEGRRREGWGDDTSLTTVSKLGLFMVVGAVLPLPPPLLVEGLRRAACEVRCCRTS